MLVKYFVVFLFAITEASVLPRHDEDQVYYITARNGGVLTAYPEEPADFPGHTYPIPGKVFVELPQNKLEQKWKIIERGSSKILQSSLNQYNEVDTYMMTSSSYPMQNVWGFEEVGDGSIYIVNQYLQARCLNNNGLGSRIHQGVCDSAGSGSKWTLAPVNSSK